MRKSLIIPILGLVILGISAFVFLNKNEETRNKDIALPSSLFNSTDFYDMKTLNQKDLNNIYIVNFFCFMVQTLLSRTSIAHGITIKGNANHWSKFQR